jgi:hypothetical protein
MKGYKTYWKDYTFSENFTQKGGQTNRQLQNLQPGTSYVFWVVSTTQCGESNTSLSTLVNTDNDGM